MVMMTMDVWVLLKTALKINSFRKSLQYKVSSNFKTLLTHSSSCSSKFACGRSMHFAFNMLFVSSILTRRKEYVLSLGNIPVMMIVIFIWFFIKISTIFMTPLAMPSGLLWSTLFVPQCIITNNVVCCKEISRTLHKTFSMQSPLIPKLIVSWK